jgi:hypothetical protein
MTSPPPDPDDQPPIEFPGTDAGEGLPGGWFIAEDANGDRMVVRLPARVEIGA